MIKYKYQLEQLKNMYLEILSMIFLQTEKSLQELRYYNLETILYSINVCLNHQMQGRR